MSERARIEWTDTVESALEKMAEGEEGARRVLEGVMGSDPLFGFFTVLSLDRMNIRGYQIMVGFSHCGRSVERFVKAVKSRDPEMIAAINGRCAPLMVNS